MNPLKSLHFIKVLRNISFSAHKYCDVRANGLDGWASLQRYTRIIHYQESVHWILRIFKRHAGTQYLWKWSQNITFWYIRFMYYVTSITLMGSLKINDSKMLKFYVPLIDSARHEKWISWCTTMVFGSLDMSNLCQNSKKRHFWLISGSSIASILKKKVRNAFSG